jgi:hypothetical protein
MLRCDEQISTVSNVNIRSENHGDSHVTATDINFTFETGAKVLDSFAKGLRDLLYTDEEKSGQKRIPGAGDGEEGPRLRFNGTLGTLAIKKEWPGYKLGIQWGDIASSVDLEFADVKICKIKVDPKDGGTCGVAFQAQCKPAKEQYGDLALLLQKEIRLTLKPPTASDLKRIEKEAREAAEKKNAGGDDEPGE